MGYTHYVRQSDGIEPTTFARLSQEAARVASIAWSEDLAGEGIAYEFNEPDKDPEFTPELIRFNGKGNEGHETFILTPGASDFNFCKTARKPYDIVVVAILCLLAHRTGAVVSSDGGISDWTDGLALAQRVEPECKMPGTIENY
jgi:hypothetical protein